VILSLLAFLKHHGLSARPLKLSHFTAVAVLTTTLHLVLAVSIITLAPALQSSTSTAPITFTFSTALNASQTAILDIPVGTFDGVITLIGPTTYVITTVDLYVGGTDIYTEPLPSTLTRSYTLALGTQVLDVINDGVTSEVTITGPTTFITTLSAAWNHNAGIFAGSNSADPHCTQSQNLSQLEAGRFVTYAESWTVLTAGQTVTDLVPQGIIAQGQATAYTNVTWTGPTTASITLTTVLLPFVNIGEGPLGGNAPGAVCGGRCGFCQLYFPTVYVYYWPVPSPNTACLSSSTDGVATARFNSSIMVVKPRSLVKDSPDASTIVFNGFTL